MQHSDVGLFGRSSSSWDTDCARKFLQIPEKDLKKLDSTPGWSTTKEINKKQEKSFQLVEGLSTSQLKIPEKTVNQLKTIEHTNISDDLAQKSALPPRKKSKISPSTIQKLYHSVPLFSNNEVEDVSTILIPRDCNSAPDVYISKEEERPSIRKLSLEDISCNMSTEQSTLSQSNKSSAGKSLLDTTYVIPCVLDDKTNDIQMVSDTQSKKTSSSPEKTSTKKRTFENLETDRLNLPFPEETLPTFGGLPVFPTNTISMQVTRDENFLSKKLRLLEKRFSPSKEFSLSLSQETMMANVNLKSFESQKNFSNKVSKAAEGFSSPATICLQVNAKTSLEPENEKAKDIPSSIKAVTKEKDVRSGAELSEKEYVEVASTKLNPNAFEEESFVSQPIPCGQPPPKDQPHSSTPQLPIKLQASVKESLVEKASMPSSEKCSNQEMSSVKGSKVGRKRKPKSKGEHTSRKPFGKKPIVVIQYTAEQIRNMIEIMKNFQSEI